MVEMSEVKIKRLFWLFDLTLMKIYIYTRHTYLFHHCQIIKEVLISRDANFSTLARLPLVFCF